MNTTLRTALAVVCIVAIAVCAVLLFGRLVGRARVADLTEHRLYTLNEGTDNILQKLNQTITLKLYYSRVAARKGPEQIRFWNNYYLYVRDLLDEFVDRSDGKLRLEVIDPRPFSDEEEEAIRYGVQRFQLSADEAFYFGLVASTELGKDEAIKFFEPDRQEFVEYDVAKILVALMQRDKRKIGVIANVPIMGTDMSPYMMQMLRMQNRRPERPWTIVSQIQQQYELEKIDFKGPDGSEDKEPVIGDDIDFLMVVHPKELDEKTKFAIDQYVMKGGKVMVFVDPHCLQDQPMMRQPQIQMQHKAASDLNDLLATWGVRLEPEKIAVDRNLAVRVSLSPNKSPESFPAYLELGEDEVNRDEVITTDLHTLRMLYPGSLTKVDGSDTEVRPLLETTKIGNTWTPAGPFELQFPDPKTIREAVTDGAEPLMLACLVTGKFKTNFPDGIEVEAGEEDEGTGDADNPKEENSGDQTDEETGDHGEIGERQDKAGPEGKKEDVEEAADSDADGEQAKPEDEKEDAEEPADSGTDGEEGKAEDKKDPDADTEQAKPEDEKEDAEEPADSGTDGEEGKAEDMTPQKKMKTLKPVTEAAEGATVVVVADVDLLTDMLAYQQSFFGMAPSGDNASFVLNTLDYLSGSGDLIRLRSRGRYTRPFQVVDEIEKKAEKATADEVKDINEKIKKYEDELKELGGAADDDNIQLIQNVAMEKRRKVGGQIREANKQLRRLQARRREEVESLGFWIKIGNIAIAPTIILIIAVVLAVFRWARAKHYAAQRT